MNQSAFQKIPAHIRQICVMLAALIPVVVVELINQGRPTLWALPFLLIGVYLGLRRQSSLWVGWWLSLSIVVIGDFWIFGMADRDPVLFTLWKPALLLCLGFIAFFIWQRGDGFLTAFLLLPLSLEFPRLILFSDFPMDDMGPFFIARLVSIFIYALAAIFILGPTLRRRWWVLFIAIFIQLAASIVLSYPIMLGFILYPTFLSTFMVLVFGVTMLGLLLDGFHSSTARWKQLVCAAALIIVLLAGFLPVLTGDAVYPAQQALVNNPTAKRQAVIIDTDMSHDDFVALLFLLRRPDLDIRAITVVNGVAHVKPGVKNVRRILALSGRTDIPVAGGPDDPIDGHRAFPDEWRIEVDWSLGPALPGVAPVIGGPSAAQLIVQQVKASSQPVRLIALGPLTNVALAISLDPTLPAKLQDIVVSGGAIDVPGAVHEELPSNPNAAADWNLYVDPVAADQVFRSGARLTLAPLDVTHPTGAHPLLLSPVFIDRFYASATGREARLMARLMRGSQLLLEQTNPLPSLPLWDLPAEVVALEPQTCTRWRDLALRILLDPDNVAGKTMIEKDKPANSHVCMDGDLTAFENVVIADSITGFQSH